MKIIPIFAEKLYSFHYEVERLDEYERLFEMWNDPEYVFDFAQKNELLLEQMGYSIDKFVEQVFSDAEVLEEILLSYRDNDSVIDNCFQPLYNQEYQPKILSLQKKRCKLLRLYAIRIDTNCYVITGGAIKTTRTMQEHPDTNKELQKLEQCKNYLQSEGVFDNDSFFEIIGG
ncbi:hypothetical protein D0T50_06935 [Bacteroides sp. 214]|uniref:hypothetical protein n=1 Tax=Bacteroides sp. 214 TaxID=2302935 RepID=UPI0013D813F0|nr:hypothetical protein [Bacteroides sp. 214]NDW12623.1 hypothetical protein [Bacteroides sp. 214]